jgi:predicted membrane-bound spermidine synthase
MLVLLLLPVLTSNLDCVPCLRLCALFAACLPAGIEALLGHSVFIYIYLISGLAGSSAVMLFSQNPDPVSCATAATVGLVGGMVGYELANMPIVQMSLASRRSKAEDGKHGSSTLRKPWGAVGVVGLMLGLGLLPGSMVDNTAHVGGLLTGLALGFLLGPKFTLVQEVDIPVGSMMVPEDCPATQVVLDRRTGLERALVGAGAVGALAAVLVLGKGMVG